ncbi:MAG: ABC transporter permease, partial [Anaerolineae bacterium]|nr:ABC transporter permease [Anaerolineae bacterium]
GWRSALYWGIGFILLGAYIPFVGQDSRMLEQMTDLVKNLPDWMMQVFGAEDITAFATPEGFLSMAYFGYAILVFAVYAVMAGLNVTANDEDEGILDVVLSLPVPRGQVIVEKFLTYALFAVFIAALGFVGIVIGVALTAFEADIMTALKGSINLVPSVWLILAFTVLMTALFRRKATATAITAVFIVASYFIDFIGGATRGSIVDNLRALSFFNYYSSETLLTQGLNIGNMLFLVIVTIGLLLASLWAFNRRDIGL